MHSCTIECPPSSIDSIFVYPTRSRFCFVFLWYYNTSYRYQVAKLFLPWLFFAMQCCRSHIATGTFSAFFCWWDLLISSLWRSKAELWGKMWLPFLRPECLEPGSFQIIFSTPCLKPCSTSFHKWMKNNTAGVTEGLSVKLEPRVENVLTNFHHTRP